MNTSCGCFSSLAAASVVPVKRYNLLVPAVFTHDETSLEQPMDPAVAKQIEKLLEYVAKNPHRGAKVSRRLARRLRVSLSRRRWNTALLVAHTYEALLTGLPPGNTPFLAWELVAARVAKPDSCFSSCCMGKNSSPDPVPSGGLVAAARGSVVGSLLASPRDDLRTSGAQLLAEFAPRQNNTDYLQQLEGFSQQLVSFLSDLANSLDAPLASSGASLTKGSPSLTNDRAGLAVASIRALDAIDTLAARFNVLYGSQADVISAVVRIYAVTATRDPPADSPYASIATASTEFVTTYSERTEKVVRARRRLSNLFRAAAAAGLWSTPLTAQPFMAAMRRRLVHQYQLYLSHTTLTNLAATLDSSQQQVASEAAASLLADIDSDFLSAAEALSTERAVSNNDQKSHVAPEPTLERQAHENGNGSDSSAGSPPPTATLDGNTNGGIVSVPAVTPDMTASEDSHVEQHDPPIQAPQVEAPEVILDKWLTAMGALAMSNEPPAFLLKPVSA